MAPLSTIVYFLFLVTETLIGMVANGSIVLINFTDWLRSGKLSPTDLILICLGLSRIWLQELDILPFILFILVNSTISNSTFSTLMSMWIFTAVVNLWFAACLSVFYLAKIAIFSHPVFLEVKRQVSGLVPWLHLGSVSASAVETIIAMTIWNYDLFACNSYESLLSNRSNAEMNMTPVCSHFTALIQVFDFIPFMVFLSSSVLLISSLWKHQRRLQHNGTRTEDLNTRAHLGALKALASFAVLFLVNFAVIISQSLLYSNNQLFGAIMLYSLSAVYPSGHAVILILINPKLKQAWVRMVHRLKCHLSKVPS